MSFWEIVWFIFISYIFIAYLVVMFRVIGDILRDDSTGGFAKAMWILALIFIPVLTLIVYLIANGSDMADRSMRRAMDAQARQEEYIRQVAAGSGTAGTATPVDQLTQAKELLDAGAISPAEFESLKTKALA